MDSVVVWHWHVMIRTSSHEGVEHEVEIHRPSTVEFAEN